jgi:putative flavoprotein involved in K+ transport
MMQTTAVVIGAGHAGLAMSRRLTERSIDHVFLERGEVANSWRTQRWPSLRLLTPNWLTRLPGYDYAGNDPDGYLPAAGVVSTLTRYARLAAAPVRTGTTVHTVRTIPGGFHGRITDGVAQFSGSLRNTCTLAGLKMNRFLALGAHLHSFLNSQLR